MEMILIQAYFVAVSAVFAFIVAHQLHLRTQRKENAFKEKLNSALKEQQALQIEFGEEHKHVFTSDDAIYWHFDRLKGEYGTATWGLKYGIYRDMLERLSPDDLLVISRSELSDQLSPNKTTDPNVLASLAKLARRGEWRHLSFVSPAISEMIQVRWQRESNRDREEAYFVGCIRSSANHQPLWHVLYCEKHLHRFNRIYSKEIDYRACRKCRNTQYGIVVKKSTLVLSESIGWGTRKEGDFFWINGLYLNELCDFDEIVVGNCSYEELERFCIIVGNDTDPWRAKKQKDIYYRLGEDATVTEQGIRLLNRFFAPLGHNE